MVLASFEAKLVNPRAFQSKNVLKPAPVVEFLKNKIA